MKTHPKLITSCPKCGNELSYFRTCRYLESGEAVCDCRQCGTRICSSADWKNKKKVNKISNPKGLRKTNVGGEPYP